MKNPITTVKANIVMNRELKVRETESRILANSAAALKDSTVSGAVAIGTAGLAVGAVGFVTVKTVKSVAHGVSNIVNHIKSKKKANNNGANNNDGDAE